MFFTIGLVCLFIGILIMKMQNKYCIGITIWDVVGAIMFWGGCVSCLYSLGAVAWKYLP